MIKTITGGPGIVVAGGGSGTYINMSMPSAGMMRYNGNTQNTEVYDGSSWIIIPNDYITVQLTTDSLELLEWAKKKKQQEEELDKFAQSNPAIKDLMKQIKEKEEQIKIVHTLIKEEVKI